ncbi:MAG: hypothetical protein AMXMBFR47_34780 [Planctomycetota bacterium]
MLNWLTSGIEGPLTALLALCAVAGAVVLLRRWQHRTGDLRRATVETRAGRREAEAVRRSLEELLAEVESATARLDDRIASRLRDLEVVEARIDARLSEFHQSPPFDPAAARSHSTLVQTPPRTESPSRSVSSPVLGAPTASIVARATRPVEPDARFAAIYELFDAGAAAPAVAEKTGVPLGEVETILGLRRLAIAPD